MHQPKNSNRPELTDFEVAPSLTGIARQGKEITTFEWIHPRIRPIQG
jgi:hypothetical protein